ncbi:MFS transporter [Kocuria dechangensis]|uniref:MFS transporter n=1 Tax=Kocuria dechangensis TaxID=1176249 RepID=A0A917GY94_9MICC|nr:MFS transporter [Kocuria dechangensis]GGG61428.1 MFS transporter [Kocuria dechangensis]
MEGAGARFYGRLIKADPVTGEAMAEDVRGHLPGNGLRLIAATTLQNAGDQVVKASTVLAWLLASLAAPGWIIGLLVPVRESGSMLPQAALMGWVRGRSQRKWLWVAGAAGQAAATAAMALTALLWTGTAAGLAILAALAVFALARALTSIAAKDVQGRTIPKGQRGQINGIAVWASGIIALTIGAGIWILGGHEPHPGVLAGLLGAAAVAWVAASLVFAGVQEPVPAPGAGGNNGRGWWARSWQLLREDVPLRNFVLVRTLLLVSALSPPFIVALAAQQEALELSGLGPFIMATGLAGIVGGRLAGRLADRSSRGLMMWGAAASSMVVLALLVAANIPALGRAEWLYPVAFFLLALTHTGVRVARKTYVVDMAIGDKRTEYVAVSNTAMGVLLLVAGGISSALATWGTGAALLFLALLGLAGVYADHALPEVSHRT